MVMFYSYVHVYQRVVDMDNSHLDISQFLGTDKFLNQKKHGFGESCIPNLVVPKDDAFWFPKMMHFEAFEC
jgi:hypothetical protein